MPIHREPAVGDLSYAHVSPLGGDIYPLGIPVLHDIRLAFHVLLGRVTVPRAYRGLHLDDWLAVLKPWPRDSIVESVDVDGTGLLDRKQRTETVNPPL